MKSVLVVFVGSGIGGVLRYLMHIGISRYFPSAFPFSTFSINILGSFLIGIFFSLAVKENILSAETRLFLITGICGGYTTFSTFSLDNLALLRSGNHLYFALYAIGSVVIGLLATYLGFQLFKTA